MYGILAMLLTSCGTASSVTPVSLNTPVHSKNTLSVVTWSNGQQIPASFGNTNFGATGPLYQLLPTSPKLESNQSGIRYYFTGNTVHNLAWIDGDSSQAQYDYSFPVYQAGPNDQTVVIHCASGGTCSDNGVTIQLPIWAQAAGGGDHHLAVLQTNGIEYDFWGVQSNPPYHWLNNLTAANESKFNSNGTNNGGYYVAPGFEYYASTAGGIALTAGQVYISELQSGLIHHALNITLPCGNGTYVWPATQISGQCSGGSGVPLGSRVWWQLNHSQTISLGLSWDMTVVLFALHDYGGFYTDSGGGTGVNGSGAGFGIRLENQEPYWIYGNGVDPVLNWAINQNWNHVTGSGINRYMIGTIGGSLDILDNLKLIQNCVTIQSC